MIVYRCVSAKEITNKYKNTLLKEPLISGENTHNYQDGISYTHFFRYRKAAEEYFESCFLSSLNPLDHFIAYMTANIPNEILKKYLGYGFYNHNDNDYNGYIPLPEYAIPNNQLKEEYIIEINNHIHYYYEKNDNEFKSYLKLVKILLKNQDYDYYKVAKYLSQNNLEELLKIIDNDRTLKQIQDNEIKKVLKIFKGKILD